MTAPADDRPTDLPEQVDRIAGRRQPPAALLGGWLCDPNTAEPLQPQRATSPDEVERALATAWEIHEAGAWQGMSVDWRAEHLEQIAVELDRRADAIAAADARTTGVVIAHTRLFAAGLGDTFRAVAALLREGWTRTKLPAAQGPVWLHRLPWGPAALLVPWNAPAAIAAGKVANALAAGCPVVLKPTEWAPSSCNLLADAIAAAGLPDGVFQMVHGGAVQGSALTGDRRVRAVSFTGSVAAGRAIARQGAQDFKALQLELGGSNPAVVRRDADVSGTAAALAAGVVKLNGQWCEAPRRVLAHRGLVEELVGALTDRLSAVRIGPSTDADSEMGPLANAPHLRRLQAQLAALETHGGTLTSTAAVPPGDGWFLPPVVVEGVDNAQCLDEIFGPVVTIHPFVDDDDAIRLANAAPGGLAAYVFSDDIETAMTLGARLHAGEVKVNGTSLLDMTPESTQSFWGLSGIGGHGSREVFRFFCGSRIVGVDRPDVPL